MMDGKKWRRNTFLTATLLPGFVGTVSIFVNFFVWHENSTKAIPFTTMIAVFFLWIGISLPLTYLGAFFGYRKDKIEPPVAVNSIPRFIPSQHRLSSWVVMTVIAGILQFGCIFVEVSSIMNAIWLHQVYYLFGFSLMVLTILCIACGELAIVICYVQLNQENYKWWWQSFLSGGAVSMYVILYAIKFYDELQLETRVASLLYFTAMVQNAFVVFLVTGSVGFFSSLLFTRAMYSSIKVD
jgi:transmembrane 9 superfamily member 2/4